jgi:CheY-like chemotaxis protein
VSKTILIVDDEEPLARVYAKALVKAGFSVVTANSAVAAFDLLLKQPIDLCISDLAMPGESGLDLLRRIRNEPRLKELPVILCSGFSQAAEAEAIKLRPIRIFSKPVSMEDLIWTVRDGLNL